MKKLQLLAYAGAIALLSTGITACSDDNLTQEITPSPGYNPETGEVTADFVFNVSMGNNQSTRMSSYFTQADANSSDGTSETQTKWFRGIDNGMLFSYKLRKNTGTTESPNWVPVDNKHVYEVRNDIGENGTHPCKFYNLGVVIGENGLTPAGSGTKSRRVLELALPMETNNLMFYGKALRSAAASNFEQGSINFHVSEDGDISKHLFSLNKIVPDVKKASLIQYENLIATALTKIVQSKITDQASVNMSGRVWAGGTVKWSDYVNTAYSTSDNVTITSIGVKEKNPITCTGETSARNMDGLSEILAQTYKTFNTIYDVDNHSELRAGSGPDVLRMVRDLYNIIKSVADATATNTEDMVAILLANKIVSNITSVFDTDNFSWKPISSLQNFTGLRNDQLSTITDKTAKLTDFPKAEFGLPYGAVILKFLYNTSAGEGEYKYKSTVPTYAMGTGNAFDPFNYVYPAELCYYGNSPVHVTDNEKTVADYPDGVGNWEDATNGKWNDWTKGSHVISSTRAVAMKNSINYGNALLKTTVKYGTGVLEDNNAQIQKERTGATEANNLIKVNTQDNATDPFRLTGILVGGQPGTVNWCFIPTGNKLNGTTLEEHDPEFSYMVYDNALGGSGTLHVPATPTDPGSASTPNYTLLWDNYIEPTTAAPDQMKVYVALEFVNNSGKDFWGMNNLIKNGATFYVTAELDPNKGRSATDLSEGITWPDPDKFKMPPYYTQAEADATPGVNAGDTKKIRRVFMQDYVTEANFVITKKTLQNALVAVPDLRSAQISLGLSVDLVWRQGLVFNDVHVGQNQ